MTAVNFNLNNLAAYRADLCEECFKRFRAEQNKISRVKGSKSVVSSYDGRNYRDRKNNQKE